MNIKKLKTITVLVMILFSMFVIVASSGEIPEKFSPDKTEGLNGSEYLVKTSVLFGRIKNVTAIGDHSTFEPVNLRIIFFQPFQFFHFTTGEPITFLNQGKGLILGDRIAIGRFNVVLPINSNSIAVMNTTLGTILLELYEDKMPNTSANFIRLANDGFYNGLVFHRVIDDFMIQGGGYYPNGTEKISPYGPIDLEINPDVHHLDGTIGMARTSDPDSATSQFFIDDGAQRFLEPGGSDPNGYAAFGRVVKGIDVVRAIAQVETMTKYGVMEDWPIDDIIIESITIIHSS